MSDSNDDIDIAIASSLKDKNPVIIDLTSDDEDDDLDASVYTTQEKSPSKNIGRPAPVNNEDGYPSSHIEGEMNQVDGRKSQSDGKPNEGAARKRSHPLLNNESQSAQNNASKTGSPSIASAMLGLDRVAMEAERLARLQQRKVRNEEALSRSNDLKRRKTSSSEPLQGNENSGQLKAKYSSLHTEEDTERLNRTTSSRHTLGERCVDIKSIPRSPIYGEEGTREAGKRTIHQVHAPKASFSAPQKQSFQAPGVKYPDGVVKKTWVKDSTEGNDTIRIEEVLQKEDLDLAVLSTFQLDADWITTKILETTKVVWVLHGRDEDELLAHPTHLRVVVPSANLVPYDWGESGVMENVCFLIDLPRLSKGRKVDPSETSDFGSQLMSFVRAMGLDPKIVESMSHFDFSRTSHLGFVHSMSVITSNSVEMEARSNFQASSIGAINKNFVKAMYLAAQGDDGSTEYAWRQTKLSSTKAGTETDQERKVSDSLKDCFRIHFPSKENVAQSKGGVEAAGTICFRSAWYNAKDFPRDLMRDAKSTRGVLMHNKMMFVQGRDIHKQDSRAWAYMGSHNLSESAWGRMVKDKATKQPKLNCSK
ncbi:hypothetical protein D0Z07_5479 [Hyphodiscus hymeniophilus]|uniref:PLD phosphodiesterase domain-containing protein n=1 Tax=Hyphodiscus hymeniophilus TaxID=353542 RepID=A0A9P7AWT3_9HELO|nr:hypothetical protein D0Z07_5479 [Hyphodiscus hymeniophilus]